MKAKDLHKLILTLELWRGGACGQGEVAIILGWPTHKAQSIFLNIGISQIDGTPTPALTNEQILIALLWYNQNALIKKLEGGTNAENPNQ